MVDCRLNGCAKGTLDCGGTTPPCSNVEDEGEGGSTPLWNNEGKDGVEPPQSKVLRTFPCAVAGRREFAVNSRPEETL
jgi:hypothetical protein